MKLALVTIAAGAAAIGCSSPPSPTSPTPPPTPTPTPVETAAGAGLSLEVVSESGGPIAPGATLHSGDKVAMQVDADHALHVYVMEFFPDGSAAVLFPEAGEDDRVSGARRVPPTGWFQLDNSVGRENVYVVASVRPLEQADASVHAAYSEIRTSGKIPPAARDELEHPKVTEAETRPETVPADHTPPTASTADAGSGSGAASGSTKTQTPRAGSATPAVGAGAGPHHASPRHARPHPDAPRASLLNRGLVRVDQGAHPRVELHTDSAGLAIYLFSFEHAGR